ncbi:MAG: amidohydrolase family protein, partial [Eubacteriales bacterium]|nr:amidohydrolase family protein [Eubacteriales bacterium]
MSYTIILNASELATNTGTKAVEGAAMGRLLTLEDAALIFRDDTILFVGTTQDAKVWLDEHLTADDNLRTLDATGKTVIPGFIDPHTHFVFGGFRDDEFNRRLSGAGYMEIMDMGGGIQATNRATKNATEDELFDAGIKRLERMLDLGITTVEGKT